MASLIPGFEYDIFISYRQKDNKGDRWVSQFVEALNIELESTSKEEVTVYFDSNPQDALLETHDVDASLKEKVKCLVFIPIISRTYCDPKSFAWEHEFKVFVKQALLDRFGLKIILPNGNVANRVLPILIHDLDSIDFCLCESVIGSVLRGVDFIYKSPGVNRPLRPNEDHPQDNLNKIYYRDQLNKVANAINEIIGSLKKIENSLTKENWSLTKPADQSNTEFLLDDDIRKSTGRHLQNNGKSQIKIRNWIHKPGKYWHKNIYKYAFSILFIVLMIILAFGRKGPFSFLNPISNREVARTHVKKAIIYIENKEFDKAKAELDIALSSDPRYSYAWSSMAALNYKEGDLNNAVMQTIKAIEFDPKNSGAAYNMAFALHDKKDYPQAIHWYKEAIKIDSAFKGDTVYVLSCSALGNLYNSNDQPIEAIIILNKAVENFPKSKYIYLVYRNLGNAYLKQEQTDSAIKYLELSDKLKPLTPETNLFLAKAYEASGKISKSIENWQNYIDYETDTVKINEAKIHLKEVTIKHLKEIIK